MSALDAKVATARAVGRLARAAGRGGGTSLPGKVLTRLQPDAIARLAARLPEGSVAISATNGKTTTAAMTAEVLRRAGHRLVHNRAGANMAGGIASSLADAARRGAIDGDLGLFEIDEFWLDRVVPALAPRSLLLANLFRDQLDRYGELELIADRWATMLAEQLPPTTGLALNADDPLIADLGRDRDDVIFFGVEDHALAMGEMSHAADSKHCRRCGAAYVYDVVYLGHLGVYHCEACGARRPAPSVRASDVRLLGADAAAFTLHTPTGEARIELPLPGLYNVYNALGAAAVCHALGIAPELIAIGLASASAAFGRAERIEVGRRSLSVLLVKNPAGANEILRTLSLEDGELDLLGILNDRTADGRDVSWVWDADFELIADRVRRATCSGTRAAELALRLKYAGVAPERLAVVPAPREALDAALAAADPESGRIFALPTYTALLELRTELARRGHVDPFWTTG